MILKRGVSGTEESRWLKRTFSDKALVTTCWSTCWTCYDFPFLNYTQKPMPAERMERRTDNIDQCFVKWSISKVPGRCCYHRCKSDMMAKFHIRRTRTDGIEEQRRCRAKQTTQASLSHRISQRNVHFDDWRLRENKPRGLCRSLSFVLSRLYPSPAILAFTLRNIDEYWRKPHRKSRKRKKVRIHLTWRASQTDQSSQKVSPVVRFCPEVVNTLSVCAHLQPKKQSKSHKQRY